MSNYANERWQYHPAPRNSSHLQEFNRDTKDHVPGAHYIPLSMDFIESIKTTYDTKKKITLTTPKKSGWFFWS